MPFYDIELVFVELTKFSKELEDLETLTDQWIYFLKTARNLDAIPETMGTVPEIKKAFEIANQANLNREELEEFEKREIYIHDQRNAIKRALRQGREQGMQVGREEGMREAKLTIAKQLLDVLDEELISQKTGLNLEDIQNLKQGRAD